MDIGPRIYSAFPYYGGKYYATPELAKIVPDHIKDVISPFLGGASLEINLANAGVGIDGNDLFGPVATFWNLITSPECYNLIGFIRSRIPDNKKDWAELRERLKTEDDPIVVAALFYNIMQHSYAGTGAAGGGYFRKPKKDYGECAQKMERFAGLPLTCANMDYSKFLDQCATASHTRKALLFADPPYDEIESIYGSKRGGTIDHAELAERVRDWEYWIVTVDASERIRSLYRGCSYVKLDHFTPIRSYRNE